MKNVIINDYLFYEVWFEIFITKDSGETQTISTVDKYDKISQEINILCQNNPSYINKLDWDIWGNYNKKASSIQIEKHHFLKSLNTK